MFLKKDFIFFHKAIAFIYLFVAISAFKSLWALVFFFTDLCLQKYQNFELLLCKGLKSF